jgi:MscS family membrane protein
MLLWLLAALAPLALAQIPGLPGGGTEAPSEDANADPLGRTSPRGAILGFSRAAERGEIVAAAQFLQLEGNQRENAAYLTNELKALIDRELRESIGRISDQPAGNLDDGLPADQERIGPLLIHDRKIFIGLDRVRHPDFGQVWLVSSATLREIPAIARVDDKTWIERNMPRSLQQRELLGASLAHWIVLLTLVGFAFVSLWLAGLLLRFAVTRLVRDPGRRANWDAWYAATRWPAITLLALLAQFIVVPSLGFPLTFRVACARVGLVVFVIALAWLLRRSMRLGFTHARHLVRGKDRASTQSLMLLAERMIQALLIVVAIVAVLVLLGVESKTALAGLGVLGVALALGAQKTVENLLGGIFLLSDKALAVGDYCTIGTQSGTVEDVTLRSVRLRTPQQSLVSLPAGSLAQAGIENFATREKMMILTTLRLRYGTSVGQLRRVLDGIRSLLQQHAKVEHGSAYARLTNFGADAIELELFAYVLTPEPELFRSIREELLLQIAAVVEAAGSALAPTRFIEVGPGAPGAPAGRVERPRDDA